MATKARPLAVVTGASTGIGYELARLACERGYNVVVAADEPEIHAAATSLRQTGATIDAVQVDLATRPGVDRLVDVVAGRPVAALIANAGRGLGHAFLDQDFIAVQRVIDTNVTGTLYLLQTLGRAMAQRGEGRILIVGSIAGFMPGTFHAVYNGTKAFIDSFALAFREELRQSGLERLTVTCLMPGPTETEFFRRAGLEDTKVGEQKKMGADEVARIGFEAMLRGEADVVAGLKNKIQAAVAQVLPAEAVAKQHANLTRPGSAKT